MTDRKAIAAAFRAAKPLLWDGAGERQKSVREYICNAIELSGHAASRQAENVIESRIGRRRTFRCWLMDRGISLNELTEVNVQAHRHAWLDMLIAEFEGEEK